MKFLLNLKGMSSKDQIQSKVLCFLEMPRNKFILRRSQLGFPYVSEAIIQLWFYKGAL